MRRIVLRLGLSVFVLGGVWACGEDEAARLAPPSHDVDNGDALQVDAAQSERVTADLVSDLALDASADLPSAPPSAPPLPVHVASPRVPVSAPTWRLTTVGEDTLFNEVLRGDFEFPAEGPDASGREWRTITQAEDGSLGDHPPSIVYAATELNLAAATGLIVRGDRCVTVFLDGAPQPLDVYGSGRMRVPLVAAAGRHVLVVRALGGRGAPVVTLEATPDPIAFNDHDQTLPDLPVEESPVQYVGVPVLNLTTDALLNVQARVVEDERFEATTITLPALGPASVTQVPFELRLKAAPVLPEESYVVRLLVDVSALGESFEHTVTLSTVSRSATHRETFRSATDGSVQYAGIVPPLDFDPARSYGLVLTLHGAGVEAIGQARAYSAKDWTFIVAATNRRPFGFDWEEWGRKDALEVQDYARSRFRIDPTREYLTGHSMGGHGTWNVGVHHPGRFAAIAPSAGWSSFQSYTGAARPGGVFGRARAHSNTNDYLSNLARRGVYILHGDADDNVPVREARDMRAALEGVVDDVEYYEEPGAGHWWDGERSAGADCVDWPPLFEFFRARTLDPFELDFTFVTPSPYVSSEHSYVTLLAAPTSEFDCRVTSVREGDVVLLEVDHVGRLEVDLDALAGIGIQTLVFDGVRHPVVGGRLTLPADAPQSEKHPGVHGPFNEVYMRPFCFIYAEDPPAYARYAAFQISQWALTGNGLACAMPASAVTDALRETHNLIRLGFLQDQIGNPPPLLTWDDRAVSVEGGGRYFSALLAYVYPLEAATRGGIDSGATHLGANLVTTYGDEHLLYAYGPFNSRSGAPDYYVMTSEAIVEAGFFSSLW